MIDPVAFRSDRLPTEHFNARFSDDNVEFWVPLLVAAARITPGLDVLDVGWAALPAAGARPFRKLRLSITNSVLCDRVCGWRRALAIGRAS